MSSDLTPFPSRGAPARRAAAFPGIENVSRAEVIGYISWLAGIFAVSLAATRIIVDRVLALPSKTELSGHFLVVWAVTWGGAALALSLLAGGLVFKRATPWSVVLTWPWLVGGAVGLAWMVALSGQMDGNTKLCHAGAHGSCDTAWGLGAILLGVFAALVLGGTFVASASLKRLVLHLFG